MCLVANSSSSSTNIYRLWVEGTCERFFPWGLCRVFIFTPFRTQRMCLVLRRFRFIPLLELLRFSRSVFRAGWCLLLRCFVCGWGFFLWHLLGAWGGCVCVCSRARPGRAAVYSCINWSLVPSLSPDECFFLFYCLLVVSTQKCCSPFPFRDVQSGLSAAPLSPHPFPSLSLPPRLSRCGR